jgi:hypothetical protein
MGERVGRPLPAPDLSSIPARVVPATNPRTLEVARNVLTARLVLPLLVLAVAAGLAVGGFTLDRERNATPVTGGSPVSADTAAPTNEPTPESGLTASANTNAAGKGEKVTISGRLTPAEEGVRLGVRRNMGDGWQDFNSSGITKSDGSFSLTVRSGRTGTNVFRVVAVGSGGEVLSNDISVNVSG